MCSKALRGVFGDGETQTSAASLAGVTLVHPVEPFKYPRLVFLGNTDTGVLDRYAVFANSDSYLAAVFVVTDGIITQVVDQFISKLPHTGDDSMFSQQLYGDIPAVRCRQ